MPKMTVRSHQMSVTPALKSYAEKKLEKLDKYFDHIQAISIELSETQTASLETRHVVSAVVKVSGAILRASQESQDMYASIDGLFEKTATQLKKYKDKLRSHKRTNNPRTVADIAQELDKEEKKSKKVEDDLLYVVKPMSEEDAAIILSDRNLPFLVFHNIDTAKVNVIYALEDEGEFGLVETH